MAARQQQQQMVEEELPIVQATSVAETIMDTMRSLEKVRAVVAGQSAGSGRVEYKWGSFSVRTWLF